MVTYIKTGIGIGLDTEIWTFKVVSLFWCSSSVKDQMAAKMQEQPARARTMGSHISFLPTSMFN